jgi:hypothetical protein
VSLDLAVSSELSLVFPTPILQRTLFTDVFNKEVARIVLGRRRRGDGKRVAGGGWQSGRNLFAWPELEVKLLVAEVLQAVRGINESAAVSRHDANRRDSTEAQQHVRACEANDDCWPPGLRPSHHHDRKPAQCCAWANVNGDGHYNPVRAHPGYQWCAIYHVANGRLAPDRVMNGVLEVLDPRPAAAFGHIDKLAFGRSLEIEPKPGLIVIFPAWLQYCVHPFFGMGHRVSITMNMTLEED